MALWMSFADEWQKTGMVAESPSSKDCFYCGDKVSYPRILWMGTTGAIELHPDCVLRLVTRLMRDRHEYEIKQEKPKYGKAAEYSIKDCEPIPRREYWRS